nr:unnamed protein product [Digitaria exilis]
MGKSPLHNRAALAAGDIAAALAAQEGSTPAAHARARAAAHARRPARAAAPCPPLQRHVPRSPQPPPRPPHAAPRSPPRRRTKEREPPPLLAPSSRKESTGTKSSACPRRSFWRPIRSYQSSARRAPALAGAAGARFAAARSLARQSCVVAGELDSRTAASRCAIPGSPSQAQEAALLASVAIRLRKVDRVRRHHGRLGTMLCGRRGCAFFFFKSRLSSSTQCRERTKVWQARDARHGDRGLQLCGRRLFWDTGV